MLVVSTTASRVLNRTGADINRGMVLRVERPDALRDGAEPALYRYCHNNPVNSVDPSGLDADDEYIEGPDMEEIRSFIRNPSLRRAGELVRDHNQFLRIFRNGAQFGSRAALLYSYMHFSQRYGLYNADMVEYKRRVLEMMRETLSIGPDPFLPMLIPASPLETLPWALMTSQQKAAEIVKKEIQRLGDQAFDIRVEATDKLVRMAQLHPAVVMPLVEKSMIDDPDLEIRERCKKIIERTHGQIPSVGEQLAISLLMKYYAKNELDIIIKTIGNATGDLYKDEHVDLTRIFHEIWPNGPK